ncbi:LysR family transcriptional regulator ArgP [Pontivivens insulae]|uniref:Putative HTH-type transcriptional regulator n=1 Tax=Pontivivens insulae TaxID=1639689 RepID=A0A2R8A8K8_9RHOB|nr:LysR family transcriptional regulator ArgP [Pontivivens insulae]RED18482.1 LysR family transcriptional regulator (chromosome initiation inhibitor) [Pontivivens insulae]SPF28380.1 putative HTH-type transcriptional regulator [Pontivivens insulae]
MLDYQALRALAEILDTGSFDAAAARLGVTPSAISQRIRQLEERVGATLIIRGSPCQATSQGRALYRHVREVAALEQALDQEVRPDADQAALLRLAVNADSLPTWFMEGLSQVRGRRFEIIIDDQDHSAELLARGDVMAAVTAQEKPLRGCDAISLGALRYRATASPEFAKQWFPDGLTPAALSLAPMLTFSRKDRLQHRWAEARGAMREPPVTIVPDTNAFVDAALGGLAWGMNPEPLVSDHLSSGRLIDLAPDAPLDTPLHWQWPRRLATVMAPVTDAIRASATRHLHQKVDKGRPAQKSR